MTRPAHPRAPRRGHTPSRPRGRPHIAAEDPATPGVCQHCHRPMQAKTDMHVSADQLPGVDQATREYEQRRYGEGDE